MRMTVGGDGRISGRFTDAKMAVSEGGTEEKRRGEFLVFRSVGKGSDACREYCCIRDKGA